VRTPDPSAVERRVRERLAIVEDPELGGSIVELGMLRSVEVDEQGAVRVEVGLTTPGCPLRTEIRRRVEAAIAGIEGVSGLQVELSVLPADERARLMTTARTLAQRRAPETEVPSRTRCLAISSGKGGVGKSSVTVNLAVALAARGLSVGILDADIWGFSVPRLLGLEASLTARARKMVPVRKTIGAGQLEVVSMGFLAGESDAIMWRGLILARALQQFLEDVWWGDLDYLLIDTPPGTGDVHMALARLLPRVEVVLVTTPPGAAQAVAERAGDMARKSNVALLGVVENMSWLTCPHGERLRPFGSGGGERLAHSLGIELLASLPFDPGMAAAGDEGKPVVLGEGGASSELAEAFSKLAGLLAEQVAPVGSLPGCTARLLERVEAAVAGKPKTSD
jgi:ATP-binding protein involved in chromosome partitioning